MKRDTFDGNGFTDTGSQRLLETLCLDCALKKLNWVGELKKIFRGCWNLGLEVTRQKTAMSTSTSGIGKGILLLWLVTSNLYLSWISKFSVFLIFRIFLMKSINEFFEHADEYETQYGHIFWRNRNDWQLQLIDWSRHRLNTKFRGGTACNFLAATKSDYYVRPH